MAGRPLQDLADLALGSPVLGAVNFSALHSLLRAIIRHLPVQDAGAEPCPPSAALLGKAEGRLQSAAEGGWRAARLAGRLEATEEGVSKAMTVLQDLMVEVNFVKDSQHELQDQMQSITAELESRQQLEQKISDLQRDLGVQDLQTEMELLKTQMKELKEKFEIFHQTLAGHPETSHQVSFTSQPGASANSSVTGSRLVTEISASDGPIMGISQNTQSQTQGSSQAEDSALQVETQHVAQDGGTGSTLENTQTEASGQQHETNQSYPETSMSQKIGINSSMTSMDPAAAPESSRVTPVLPTGVASKEHAMLYARVDALERDKADRSELGLLQKNTDDLATILHDLQEQQSNQNSEIQDLGGDSNKLDRLQRAMELMADDQKLEEPSLPATIEEIERELKELQSRQKQENANSELSAADAPPYLHDQDGEPICHLQKTMLQLQEQCEWLTRATGALIQDHEQKPQHIDILYQKVENLDMKKVDKELIGLEADVKPDKHALESKVSRTQFDATTEQLSQMIQELLGKVSAQEQDWQRLLEKINVELQNKLDRIELEPLKNILEQCWRNLRRQLQAQPPQYEADEAAGIRKQLMRRFHCISCNRTVDMVVPGPEMLTIPNIPGLPAHRSNRPHTVFELDQVRQQTHNDRLSQLSDFGYTSSSRYCGGSHTLTFPQRRSTRLPAGAPCTVQKEDFVGDLKEEAFILGQDGHIYRGRRVNHLPAIKTKDDKRSTVAHQKMCYCNWKGEENFLGCSSVMASDIQYGLSKAGMKSAWGSEKALPSIKDSIPPMCYQRAKAT